VNRPWLGNVRDVRAVVPPVAIGICSQDGMSRAPCSIGQVYLDVHVPRGESSASVVRVESGTGPSVTVSFLDEDVTVFDQTWVTRSVLVDRTASLAVLVFESPPSPFGVGRRAGVLRHIEFDCTPLGPTVCAADPDIVRCVVEEVAVLDLNGTSCARGVNGIVSELAEVTVDDSERPDVVEIAKDSDTTVAASPTTFRSVVVRIRTLLDPDILEGSDAIRIVFDTEFERVAGPFTAADVLDVLDVES